MNNFELRMNRLEKQVRTYRLVSIVLLLGISLALVMGFKDKTTPPDVLRAKSFQVVNDNGDVVAEMNMEKGNGLITTMTPRGRKLFQVFTTEGGGGGINTFDNDGEVNFKVTRTTDGGGYMALFNSTRKEIFEVGTTTANSGYFRVNDKYGEKLAWLTYTEGGGGYFSLAGRDNKELIKLSTPDAGGRVGIYNGNNERINFIGAMDNKDGNITVYDNYGKKTGSVPNY